MTTKSIMQESKKDLDELSVKSITHKKVYEFRSEYRTLR